MMNGKFREHLVNEENNFITGYYMDDDTLMDKIIECHHKSNKIAGRYLTADGDDDGVVDKSVKDSLDTALHPDVADQYLKNLRGMVDQLREKYPSIDFCDEWGITQPVRVQEYPPSGGFHAVHTERFGKKGEAASRWLVFMTYLNDIEEGGYTDFVNQKLMIKPEKGLTLFWGTDWMFAHRGIPAPKETKFITTGWYNFV